MLKPQRIEIKTIFGIIFAEISGDSTYPGIAICIEDESKGKQEKQLARVEATPDSPRGGVHSLRLFVWNGDGDDFSNDFTFFETDSANVEEEEPITSKYVAQGCKEVTHEDETYIEGNVPDNEAEFWGVYRYENGEYIHMTGADFKTKEEADIFAENMNHALKRKGLL
jgi:hypothetical protein